MRARWTYRILHRRSCHSSKPIASRHNPVRTGCGGSTRFGAIGRLSASAEDIDEVIAEVNGGPGPASIALPPQRRWDGGTPLRRLGGCVSYGLFFLHWWSHDNDGEVERGAGDYVTAVAKLLWIVLYTDV